MLSLVNSNSLKALRNVNHQYQKTITNGKRHLSLNLIPTLKKLVLNPIIFSSTVGKYTVRIVLRRRLPRVTSTYTTILSLLCPLWIAAFLMK